jgi:hypothetical protein
VPDQRAELGLDLQLREANELFVGEAAGDAGALAGHTVEYLDILKSAEIPKLFTNPIDGRVLIVDDSVGDECPERLGAELVAGEARVQQSQMFN